MPKTQFIPPIATIRKFKANESISACWSITCCCTNKPGTSYAYIDNGATPGMRDFKDGTVKDTWLGTNTLGNAHKHSETLIVKSDTAPDLIRNAYQNVFLGSGPDQNRFMENTKCSAFQVDGVWHLASGWDCNWTDTGTNMS